MQANPPARVALPPVPLIGRATERTELLAAVNATLAGQAQTVFLTGDTGVGKTRLARHVADHARANGFSVAEGRAFAVETGMPYAIFADALLPTLRQVTPAALNVLTRGGGAELAAILPALFPPQPVAYGEGAEESKARMFWSFTEFVTRLAAREPLLLLLDNLQWADASSLELLHFVARQVHGAAPAARLMIIATVADVERDEHASVRAIQQSLVSLGAARSVRLAAWSVDETIDLLHRVFDTQAARVREFAVTLHSWTSGNPFFIEETLRSLVERGRLRQQDGHWSGWDVHDLVPPSSVRDVVLDRVARLGSDARAVVDLAAVLGARVALDALVATSDLPRAALLEAVDDVVKSGVLVEVEGTAPAYDFAHPLARDAVYGALGRMRVQRMHDHVATALEQFHGGHAAAHAAELAHHFSAGTLGASSPRVAEYLTEAGVQALARHADLAGLEYLESALVEVRGAGPPMRLLDALAHARQRAGDFRGAAELWRRVRAQAVASGDTARAAESERRMGLMAATSGDSAAALSHFDAGVQLLEPLDGAGEAMTRMRLARANALQAVGRREEALADAHVALATATATGLCDDALLARVHRAMQLLHVWTGPAHTARMHGEQAVAFAKASGQQTVEWSAHWAMAIHGGLTGDAAFTAHHVGEARRLADEVRSPVLRLWTADVAIEYLAGIGEWREALALADDAIPRARALGQRTLLPRLLVWTGLIHRGLGDLEAARVLIEEAWALTGAGATDEARAHDAHALVPVYTGMTGYLMTVGENGRALEVGEEGLAIADRAGYVAWAIYRLLPFVIETALYLEDYERAAHHNARLRRDSVALGHPLGVAWADTTDALLAYLTGDAVRAVPMLRAAMAALEQVPFVFDAARLRRLIARALLDAGDVEGAAQELRSAHAVFVRLGAEREMRATREQLREIGARVPAAPRGGEDAAGLSAREAEIARLVADRKSNKEIGAALDISSRTVSTHLSNIFQKLGVASRGELTDLVRGGALDRG